MTDSLWRKRQEPERSMKVEGPLHVVCQCDKCKAKQEQGEPVAFIAPNGELRKTAEAKDASKWGAKFKPLYTTPQHRTWVGLTDEDCNDCLVSADPCECLATPEAQQLMKDVEAKLKEKNG